MRPHTASTVPLPTGRPGHHQPTISSTKDRVAFSSIEDETVNASNIICVSICCLSFEYWYAQHLSDSDNSATLPSAHFPTSNSAVAPLPSSAKNRKLRFAASLPSAAAAPPPLAVAAVSWSRCQSPGLTAAEGASPAILRNLTTGCRSRGAAEAGAFARPHDAFPRSSEPCRPWPLSDSCAEVEESSPFRLP